MPEGYGILEPLFEMADDYVYEHIGIGPLIEEEVKGAITAYATHQVGGGHPVGQRGVREWISIGGTVVSAAKAAKTIYSNWNRSDHKVIKHGGQMTWAKSVAKNLKKKWGISRKKRRHTPSSIKRAVAKGLKRYSNKSKRSNGGKKSKGNKAVQMSRSMFGLVRQRDLQVLTNVAGTQNKQTIFQSSVGNNADMLAATFATSGDAATTVVARLLLESISLKMTLLNRSNFAQVATIYWCTPVRDITTATLATPLDAWTLMASRTNLNQNGSTTGAGTDILLIDQSPRHYPDFFLYWKIISSNQVKVPAGQDLVLFKKKKFGKIIHEQLFTTDTLVMRGYTLYCMIVLHGEIGTVAGGAVGYAPANVTGTTEREYSYRHAHISLNAYQDTQSGSLSGATLSTINPFTEAAVAYTVI